MAEVDATANGPDFGGTLAASAKASPIDEATAALLDEAGATATAAAGESSSKSSGGRPRGSPHGTHHKKQHRWSSHQSSNKSHTQQEHQRKGSLVGGQRPINVSRAGGSNFVDKGDAAVAAAAAVDDDDTVGLTPSSLVASADDRYRRGDYYQSVRLYNKALAMHESFNENEHDKEGMESKEGEEVSRRKSGAAATDGIVVVPLPAMEQSPTAPTGCKGSKSAAVGESGVNTTEDTISLSSNEGDNDNDGGGNDKEEPMTTEDITEYPTDEITSVATNVQTTSAFLLKKGNACYRAAKYDDAIETYTSALETLNSFVAQEKELWKQCTGNGSSSKDACGGENSSTTSSPKSEVSEASSPSCSSSACSSSSPSRHRSHRAATSTTTTTVRVSHQLRMKLDIRTGNLWNNLGNAYLKKTAYERALSSYEESMKVKTRLLRSNKMHGLSSPSPSSSGGTSKHGGYMPEVEIGRTLHNIGLVHGATGKKELAMEAFKDSLAWKKKLTAGDGSGKTSNKALGTAIANSLSSLASAIVTTQDEYMRLEKGRRRREELGAAAQRGRCANISICSSITGDSKCDGDDSSVPPPQMTEEEEAAWKKQQQLILQHEQQCAENTRKALKLYQQALSIRRVAQGSSHLDAASSMYNIALLQYTLGKYDKSAAMAKEALTVQKRHLAATGENDDLGVGCTLHTLGMALTKLGQHDLALPILKKALKMKRLGMGTGTVSKGGGTAAAAGGGGNGSAGLLSLTTVKFHIGMVHYMRNERDSAASLFRQTYRVRLARLGPDHDAVATVLFAVSEVLRALGRYDCAVEGYGEVLRVRERCLGRYHLDVAEVLRSLGAAHASRGQPDTAEEVLARAVKIYRLHPDSDKSLAATLRQMADVKLERGRHEEAVLFYDAVIGLRQPEETLDMAGVYYTVAGLHFKMGNYKPSKLAYSEALKIRRGQLPTGDESILSTLTNLGHSQYKLGELEDAMETYQESLRLKQDKLCGDGEDFSTALDNIANREFDAKAHTLDGLSASLGDIAATMNNLGLIHQNLGETDEALNIFKLALKIRNIQPAADNRDVLAATAEKIGLLEFNKGMYDEALASFSEALHLKKLKQGDSTVDVANTLNSIANVHYSRGELDECMEMYQEALKIKRELLGPNHVAVSNTLNNMANVYHAKGCYDQAVESYTQALKVQRHILGSDHLDLAATLSNLADVQCKRQHFDKAMIAYEKALRIRRKKPGTNPAEIAILLSNIGTIHLMQGKFRKALEVYSEEVSLRRSELSQDKSSLAKALTNVGRAYHQLGDFEGSLVSYRESIRSQEETLKEMQAFNSPVEVRKEMLLTNGHVEEKLKAQSGALGEFSSTLRNIGLVYQDKGETEKALNAFKAALKYKKMQLGDDNLDVAFITESIALCYFNMTDYAKSQSSFSEALRIKKLNLGEENVDVATTYNNLANVHYTLGELQKAMEAYAKAFLIKKALLGDDHLDIAIMLNNIASIYAEEDDIDEAIDTYSEALRVRRKHGDSMTVASTLCNLGEMYAKKDEFAKAIECYEETLQIRIPKLGKDHKDVMAVRDIIAGLHAREGDHDKAVEFYSESLASKSRTLGTDHLEHARTQENMAVSLIEVGQYAEALKNLRQVLPVKKAKLGESHKEFLATISRIGVIHSMAGSERTEQER